MESEPSKPCRKKKKKALQRLLLGGPLFIQNLNHPQHCNCRKIIIFKTNNWGFHVLLEEFRVP